MKKVLSLVAMTVCLLVMCGCSLRSPEEMYTLPQPPAEYNSLNTCIQETMVKLGAEYAAPLSGDNTQTVQLVDLNGDKVNEAVAFFRVTGDDKPLKVYMFRQDQEGNYSSYAVIEGEGTAIYSISYENLGKGIGSEIIVSWRMSEKVHSLAAYYVGADGVTEWMRTGYSGYRIMDMDMDNQKEILVLQVDVTENKSRVELFDYQDNTMILCASAPMSSGIKSINAVRTGFLRESVPALFVASAFGGGNGVLTDIFAWQNGTLANVTLDEERGQSLATVRYYNLVSGTDINGDNVLEIPIPEALPVYQKTTVGTAADFWVVDWRQYDINGNAWSVGQTYHNVQDRWYLILPEEWYSRLTLTRKDNTVYNERGVVFSLWRGEYTEPVPFLVIYRLTGDSRESRGQIGNRFILETQSDAVYAAEFLDYGWDCGVNRQELQERFRLIKTTWSDDD